MRFQFVQPSGFLKNFIKHYCFMETGLHDGNIVERVIPIESVQLMFHYGNPFVFCKSDNTTTPQPRSVISGLSSTYIDVSTHGEAGVVFVQFYPAGACHFLRFPLSEIENLSCDLSDLFSAEVRRVEEKLIDTITTTEKVAVIESFLTSKFTPIPSHDSQLMRKGVDLIKLHRGQISANSLSEKLSITPKSLERKFSNHLGKTPKQYIKLIRFQQTLADFSLCKDINLTEYAYRNGYFDQSHFIHDFKTYSGYTPGEFLAKYPNFNINADSC